MKRLYQILGIVAGSFFGVFLGHAIFRIIDYRSHPDLYAMNSAPWYLGIQINAVCTAVIIAVLLVIRRILRKKLRDRNEGKE